MLSIRSNHYRMFCFIVAGITLFLYLPSLNNGFVNWDDNILVYENPSIRSIDSNLIKAIFSPKINPTMVPLTLFSYAMDYAFWGLDPFHFHLTNLFIHTLNTILVFILILRLVESGMLKNPSSPPFAKGGSLTTPPLKKGDTGGFIPNFQLVAASVTALLFGIHPLNAEAVNWVTGRSDLLAAFFFLLSVLSYLRFVIQSSSRNLYYALSLLSFLLSLMSKPTSVSLPLILLVLDLYLLKSHRIKEALTNKSPFFILSLLSVVVTLWYRQSHAGNALGGLPLIMRLLIASRSFMSYLYKMALPFNLAPYYPYPKDIDLLSPWYPVSFILLTSLTVFCIMGLKRKALFSGVWLFYIISLAPMVAPLLGFYKIGSYAEADRYTYIASIGPFLLAGVGIARIIEPKCILKNWGIALMCIAAILLSIRTVGQISIWKNSISLWSHEIRIFPKSASIAYNDRGNVYAKSGEYEKALNDFNKAIELDPKYVNAFNNRGIVYKNLGLYDKAIADLNIAIALNPSWSAPYHNLGSVYIRIGNFEKSRILDEQAVRLER